MAAAVPTLIVDHIRSYVEVLPPWMCQGLIDRFERDVSRQTQRTTPGFCFSEINVTQAWSDAHLELAPLFTSLAHSYAIDVGMTDFWPQLMGYEQIRLKRYRPGTGESFPPHLDVRDYPSARRFLVMFVYLNDVEVGGETSFPQWGLSVRPQAGKALVFPPGMPFVHAGEAPVSGPKYILGSYLHYV